MSNQEEIALPEIYFSFDPGNATPPAARSMAQHRVGSARIDKVYELDGLVMPLADMFALVQDEDVARAGEWVEDPFLDGTVAASHSNLSWHSLLIRVADEVILIDTGHGNGKQRPFFVPDSIQSDFMENLAEFGVTPSDITMVICTHGHYDHVGWNTVRSYEGKWVPTFPLARYLMSETDLAWWKGMQAHTPDPAFDENVLPILESGQMEAVQPGQVLINTGEVKLRIADAAGHTPGSILIYLESESDGAVFAGDVIHHITQIARPEINMPFEIALEDTIRLRKRLLAEWADSGVAVFPAHFNGSSGGYIRRQASGGYRWEPLPLKTPGVTAHG